MNQMEMNILATLWAKVFLNDEFSHNDDRVSKIGFIYTKFQSSESSLLFGKQDILFSSIILVDIEELCRLCNIPDLYDEIITRPSEVISILSLSLSLLRMKKDPYLDDFKIIHPRLYNFKTNTSLSEIKSGLVGQLVSVEGHVVRVSPCRPLVTMACFCCAKCQKSKWYQLDDGIFSPPLICSTPKCKNKILELDRNQVITIPYQRIKLQECFVVDDDCARIPRTVDIEAREDLINQCRVGDHVRVIGIVSTMHVGLPKFSKGVMKESGLHQLYLVAHALEIKSSKKRKLNETSGSSFSRDEDSVENQYQVIRSIATHPNAVALMISSMCPLIFGHEIVKLGLLLSLFGGTSYNMRSETNNSANNETEEDFSSSNRSFNVRSDIHVLMVGDPGLGKSQMLRAVAAMGSRVVMVSGNATTTAGLTVTVARDGRDSSLEAGALVLADRGICCIDELDKISCDSHALLEAMEQQRISVAKGGVVTSLRSRASIIAAANPKDGHYNKRKSVNENLRMPAALLSRFDLIFILVDKPEEYHDRKISEHIMKSSGNDIRSYGYGATNKPMNEMSVSSSQGAMAFKNAESSSISLNQRLRQQCRAVERQDHLLSPTILKTYIEYAKKYCHPQLSIQAAKVLQKFYLTLRSKASSSCGGGDGMPVTTRHLESLIRLAQARAKMELRTEVLESDAMDVVNLLEESVLDAFSDDMGCMVEYGKRGMSVSKQVKALVGALKKESLRRGSIIFAKSDIAEIVGKLKLERDVDSLIEMLRTECYLLMKGQKMFELRS